MNKSTTGAVTIAAADLLRAIRFATQPIERRNVAPVLGAAHIRAQAGALTITGTDLDTECQITVEAESAAPFATCVGPKAIAVISGFGGRVTLTLEQSVLRVEGAGVTARFNSLIPADDFPFMADDLFLATEGETAVASVPERVLWQALDDCIPAISTEETRYYLHGVYLHSKEDGLMRSVATDGHRLALRKTDVPFAGLDGIANTKAVKILARALDKAGDGLITVSGAGLYREFKPEGGAWRVRARMIDGTYPDYMRVLPGDEANVSVPVTLEQIQRVAILADQRTNIIAFDPDGGKLSLKSPDSGVVEVPLPGGRGERFGLNLRYIRDALRKHGTAVLESKRPTDPFRVVTEDPDLTMVIMPARVW